MGITLTTAGKTPRRCWCSHQQPKALSHQLAFGGRYQARRHLLAGENTQQGRRRLLAGRYKSMIIPYLRAMVRTPTRVGIKGTSSNENLMACLLLVATRDLKTQGIRHSGKPVNGLHKTNVNTQMDCASGGIAG
jgi:hypothetical protein